MEQTRAISRETIPCETDDGRRRNGIHTEGITQGETAGNGFNGAQDGENNGARGSM